MAEPRNIKPDARQLVESLPDTATWDDLAHEVYVRQSVEAEHAVTQLAALAEFISLDSPFYAEQVVDRIVARFEQARRYPASGRMVPEFGRDDVRELIEPPCRLVDAVEVLSILHGRQQTGELPEALASRPTG